MDIFETNKNILLHTCCAPCAGGCVSQLLSEKKKVTLFFSNSNLCDFKEYEMRLSSVKELAKYYSIDLIVDEYNHISWLKAVNGYEMEKEKGKRCPICFDFSFSRTAKKAKELRMKFTTSLTVSPHKSSKTIFELGSKYEDFLQIDFKKNDGFLKSRTIAKEQNFYMQNFCGCEFSKH